MTRRPNVLLLHAHDAGRAVEPYGWPVRTPHLMAFAREGVLFRNAHCVSPTCGPSRAAMMTGCYPQQNGVFGLPGRAGWAMRDPSMHLVHRFNAGGYLTALAGCQHECDGADLSPLGYQRLLNTREPKGQFWPDTIDHVERFLAEDHGDTPFFLSVGTDEPHRNNLARPELGIGAESARFSKTRLYDPDRLEWKYTAPPPWLPDLPEIRRDTESLHEGVRIMDAYFGRVLSMLRQRGLEQSTLVIVTTDHGIEFAGGKKTLTDQGTGVMLVMRGPGGFTGGRVMEALVSQLDLAPTLIEIAGLEKCLWHEGRSLLPLVASQDDRAVHHEQLFTCQTYHGPLEALRAIRTRRHKLVVRHEAMARRLRPDGPTTPLLAELGWFDRHDPTKVELYDLMLDPMEACNRAADPAYAEDFADLRIRLESWMLRTGDPFPTGEFPPIPRP